MLAEARDCNSHELRSRATFTARTLCACSEPGDFVAASNPMPITTKMKHPPQYYNTALSNIETFLFIGFISVKAPYGNIICGTV